MGSASIGPGVVLSGRYRLEESIGSGATATVWRAVDVVLDRRVAIKVLRATAEPEFRRRFDREARILSSLEHPNLARVLDVGSASEAPYMVMELVDGEALDTRLARGPLPVGEATTIAAAVAAGLEHAHRAGVVHRDVKPANIIVASDGRPVLVDFGIARSDMAMTMTQPAAVLGTANYLAPEQARGVPVDGRADIYALGCALYEMLTGEPPFTGDGAVAVAYRHVHDVPAPPSARRAGIPRSVEVAVLRALAKDPSQRQASAHEFAAALTGTPDGDTTYTTQIAHTAVLPPVASAARDRSRGRRAAVIVALIAIATAIGLAALASGFGRGEGAAVELPNVVGRSLADATRLLEDLGLESAPTEVDAAAAAGTVIAQDPAAGTDAKPGTPVELTVSNGNLAPPEDAEKEKDEDNDENDDEDERRGDGDGKPGRGKGRGRNSS